MKEQPRAEAELCGRCDCGVSDALIERVTPKLKEQLPDVALGELRSHLGSLHANQPEALTALATALEISLNELDRVAAHYSNLWQECLDAHDGTGPWVEIDRRIEEAAKRARA
jgi:hypothetical protein